MEALVESVNVDSFYSLNTLMAPVNVYLKVTGACDLKCSFCSQAYASRRHMDFESAKNLLTELKQMGVVSITYTGGEPLLYPSIKPLLKYGQELGFHQTLVTNGVHLLDDVDILSMVQTIGISLHGTPKCHDALCGVNHTFSRVQKNIDILLKDYPNLSLLLNCTLSFNTIHGKNMEYVVEFAKKRNLEVCFGRLNYLGNAKEDEVINPNLYLEKIHKFKQEYSKISISNCISPCSCDPKYQYLTHSCGAGQTMFAIEANGDVKICPSSNYILGNVFQTKLSKLLHGPELRKFYQLNWLPNTCQICKSFLKCKGGCHAEGDGKFFLHTCDALLLQKEEQVWEKIHNQKLIMKNVMIRKEKKNYLLISVPLRKINSIGYHTLSSFNGEKTGEEILALYPKISNMKDFIITLYLDGIIEVRL